MKKKPPKEIYLQFYDDENNIEEEITWCEDRINENDVIYVLKEDQSE